MSLSYGFFNAELTSSGQYDRVYAAEQFAEYFNLIVKNGVFPDPSTQLQVVASSVPDMNVNVSAGFGWINGYYAKNDSAYSLAIQAANGSLNRIDIVVLRWVNETRSMELAVKTGTASGSPTAPELQRDSDIYELMLASITVSAGATSISQSAITDKRPDSSVCGWVTGAVQNIDTTNLFAQYDDAFNTWFEDIQSQLEGDVATNLQNQINELEQNKVNVSDKASNEEAQAGTDDTKWMTPAKTKVVVGTAPETVKDERTGNLIRVTTGINTFGISNFRIVQAHISSTAYEGFSSDGTNLTFYEPTKTIYAVYFTRNGSAYNFRLGKVQYNESNNNATFEFVASLSNSQTNDYLVQFIPMLYKDNDIIAIYDNSYRYRLYDITNNRLSNYGSYTQNIAGFFSNDNYIGAIYISDYSRRVLEYKLRSSTGNFLALDLGDGASDSYFLTAIGVTNDYLWFIERGYTNTQLMISRVNFTSAVSFTQGFLTLTTPNVNCSITPICFNEQYAYMVLFNGDGIPYNKILRVSLIDGSSNISEITSSNLSNDLSNNMYLRTNSIKYLGTIGNTAYFRNYSSSSFVQYPYLFCFDKTDLNISVIPLDNQRFSVADAASNSIRHNYRETIINYKHFPNGIYDNGLFIDLNEAYVTVMPYSESINIDSNGIEGTLKYNLCQYSMNNNYSDLLYTSLNMSHLGLNNTIDDILTGASIQNYTIKFCSSKGMKYKVSYIDKEEDE